MRSHACVGVRHPITSETASRPPPHTHPHTHLNPVLCPLCSLIWVLTMVAAAACGPATCTDRTHWPACCPLPLSPVLPVLLLSGPRVWWRPTHCRSVSALCTGCCAAWKLRASHITGHGRQPPHRVVVHGLLFPPLLALAVQASAAMKTLMRVPCCTWQESLWAQASECSRWAGGTHSLLTVTATPSSMLLGSCVTPSVTHLALSFAHFLLDYLLFLTDI